MDVVQMMERLGEAGVTVLLKVDHERTAEGTRPWTIVMSGPAVGESEFLRLDAPTFAGCIAYVATEMQLRGGEWSWLGDYAADLNGRP